MQYLRNKYKGYQQVDRRFLKDELLLSDKEFADVKRDIAHTLGKSRCPLELDLDVFCDVVDAYLP